MTSKYSKVRIIALTAAVVCMSTVYASAATYQAPALWRVYVYSGPGLPSPTISCMGCVITNTVSAGIKKTGLYQASCSGMSLLVRTMLFCASR